LAFFLSFLVLIDSHTMAMELFTPPFKKPDPKGSGFVYKID